jgi:mannose-1-phosphate guanylyltransferase/phosphomannomutase
MKAMILCAGKGTRLGARTGDKPKCMLRIGTKPLVEHTIDWLHSQGINEIVINLSHLPEAVRGYFADGASWGVNIQYSFEETALGTAGGVKNAERFLGRDEPFLVWYGDNLSRCNIHSLSELHRERRGIATIALTERADPWASGIAEFGDSARITRFLEKPSRDKTFSSWVNGGIMVCDPSIFDLIPPGSSDFGHDVLPRMIEDPRGTYAYRLNASESLFWIDTPGDFDRVEQQFANGNWPGAKDVSSEQPSDTLPQTKCPEDNVENAVLLERTN